MGRGLDRPIHGDVGMPQLRRPSPTRSAILLFGFAFLALGVAAGPAVAPAEIDYVLGLVGLLDEAGSYLTQARLALNSCLADQTACASNSTPFREQIQQAKVGVDEVRVRVHALQVPPKYVEVQGMAVESLANISTALELLNVGLLTLDPAPIQEAGLHLDSARQQIVAIYERIQATPPTSDSNLGTVLVPVVAILAAIVAVNLAYTTRSMRRDVRLRKRDASKCPYCGTQMTDFDSYPLKTVQDWMATHRSAYHPAAGASPK